MGLQEVNGDNKEVTKENKSKPLDLARKRLEWLASAKVGEELIGNDKKGLVGLGFQTHLGYGTTDITIEGIRAENLRVYEKDGIYYITNKDKNSLEVIYDVKDLKDADLNKVIGDLEQSPNSDKIKWDLPKLHAIRTAESKEQWEGYDGDDKKKKRPKILITDSEKYVLQKIRKEKNFITNTNTSTDAGAGESSTERQTGSGKKGWRAMLPCAETEIEISSDKQSNKKDNEIPSKEEKERQELIYKVFHGEISKDKIDGDESLKGIHEVVERNKDGLNDLEGKILEVYYYTRDQEVRKGCIEKYRVYMKYISDEIDSNANKDQQELDNSNHAGYKRQEKENILKGLETTLESAKQLHKDLEDSIHSAVKHQLSGLGLNDELLDPGEKKIYIKGDLYPPKEGNSSYLLTDKKLGSDSVVPVDNLEQRGNIKEKIKEVQCDLKVYVLQKQDKSNSGKPEILITDDRHLVEKRIRKGWEMARPGTQTGIELGNGERKKIYDAYNKLCKETDDNKKSLRKKIDICDEVFGKFYWSLPEEHRQQYEEPYRNCLNALESGNDGIKETFSMFVDYLYEKIGKNSNLSISLKENLLGRLEEEKIRKIDQIIDNLLSTPVPQEKKNEDPDIANGKKLQYDEYRLSPEEKGYYFRQIKQEIYKDNPRPWEIYDQGQLEQKIRDTMNTLGIKESVNGGAANDRGSASGERNDNSANSTETQKKIEEEIAVTHAYYDLLSKVEGVELPNADDNRLAPQNIAKIKIEDIKSEERQGFLKKIEEFNKSLRRVAEDSAKEMPSNAEESNEEDIKEKDLNPFQRALKEAIDEAKKCQSFAVKWDTEYRPCFNFSEPWLQNSMHRQGIEPENICENIKKSYEEKLLKDAVVRDAIHIMSDSRGRQLYRTESKKNAYECSKDEIVDKFEKVKRASADLNYFYEKLNDGIPVEKEDIPEKINGLKCVPTSANENNCLIHALLKVNNPKLDMNTAIRSEAEKIRDILKVKMHQLSEQPPKDKDINQICERMQEVDNDQMLDLANDDGEELIKYLREKKKIEPDRSLRVYEYKNGKLRCYELYRVESSSKPPYTLFLVNDNHFEAMVKPEDLPDEERS